MAKIFAYYAVNGLIVKQMLIHTLNRVTYKELQCSYDSYKVKALNLSYAFYQSSSKTLK